MRGSRAGPRRGPSRGLRRRVEQFADGRGVAPPQRGCRVIVRSVKRDRRTFVRSVTGAVIEGAPQHLEHVRSRRRLQIGDVAGVELGDGDERAFLLRSFRGVRSGGPGTALPADALHRLRPGDAVAVHGVRVRTRRPRLVGGPEQRAADGAFVNGRGAGAGVQPGRGARTRSVPGRVLPGRTDDPASCVSFPHHRQASIIRARILARAGDRRG